MHHTFQGILDIIMTSLSADGNPKISVLEHKFVDDACFIKVMGRYLDHIYQYPRSILLAKVFILWNHILTQAMIVLWFHPKLYHDYRTL